MQQIPLAIGPTAEPSFENFVATAAHREVLLHLRGLQPRRPSPPVYLWGPAGSGKTHLLHALARDWRARGHAAAWFDARDPGPWRVPDAAALVIVDRCEGLEAQAQREAFALFIEAGAESVQWVAAGRLPPVDLPLRDDLRTRLGWGHVFALQPLDEAATRAVLKSEAGRRGIVLGDEVLDHLLTRLPRGLDSLMPLLERLDEFSLSQSRTVTVPLVRRMLAEIGAGEEARP